MTKIPFCFEKNGQLYKCVYVHEVIQRCWELDGIRAFHLLLHTDFQIKIFNSGGLIMLGQGKGQDLNKCCATDRILHFFALRTNTAFLEHLWSQLTTRIALRCILFSFHLPWGHWIYLSLCKLLLTSYSLFSCCLLPSTVLIRLNQSGRSMVVLANEQVGWCGGEGEDSRVAVQGGHCSKTWTCKRAQQLRVNANRTTKWLLSPLPPQKTERVHCCLSQM